MGAFVTAIVLTLAIRGLLHPARADSGWLITSDGWLPSWLPTVANVTLYAGFCWTAFSLTRAARGRERLFIAAWFADILLSPLKALGALWSLTISYICAFGLATALLIAMSLVLERSNVTGFKS